MDSRAAPSHTRAVRRLGLALLLLGACDGTPAEEPHDRGATADREPIGDEGDGDEVDRDEIDWPALPDGLPAEVERCVEDYRELAGTPFPAAVDGQPFRAWYAGPFQGYVSRYDTVRGRCDAAFEALDEEGPAAQVVLATQSRLHVHMAEQAAPYEAQAEMFVLARYWTLGASCTYEHCADGPLEAWAALCEARAEPLPPCPAVPPQSPAPEPEPDPAP